MNHLLEQLTLAQLENLLQRRQRQEARRIEQLERQRERVMLRLERIRQELAQVEAEEADTLRRINLLQAAPPAPAVLRWSPEALRQNVLEVMRGRVLTLKEIQKAVQVRDESISTNLFEVDQALKWLIDSGQARHLGRGLHELAS